MKLENLVQAALAATPTDEVMAALRAIAHLDRYQASSGIEAAAREVRDRAFDWGLSNVEIRKFAADGKTRWWNWQAPASWSPLEAKLTIGSGKKAITLDHSKDPFTIGAYSHPTPAEGLELELHAEGGDPGQNRGSLLLLDSDIPLGAERTALLEQSGIAGFISDGAARATGEEGFVNGRIELPQETKLFAFSTTPEVMSKLRQSAASGARAHALVLIDRSASMPVVTGTIPGQSRDEAWLVAHLCHPRPSANDNASGVAALLGAVRVLSQLRAEGAPQGLTLRFIWGPEFLGSVALLHELAESGLAGPRAVINVDMVGEDQFKGCGPFVLERHPDYIASPLNRIAEGVISEVFRQTDDGCSAWKSIPFQGFSDHALFASPPFEAAAVQLAHERDPYNHSAADDVDKVSAREMQRATVASAAIAFQLARTSQDFEAPRISPPRATPRDGEGTKLASVRSFIPARTWQGPVNIRALLWSLDPDVRRRVNLVLESDRNSHAWLYNIASRVDGRRSFGRILDEVGSALEMRLNAPAANAFYEMLSALSAGKANPAPLSD